MTSITPNRTSNGSLPKVRLFVVDVDYTVAPIIAQGINDEAARDGFESQIRATAAGIYAPRAIITLPKKDVNPLTEKIYEFVEALNPPGEYQLTQSVIDNYMPTLILTTLKSIARCLCLPQYKTARAKVIPATRYLGKKGDIRHNFQVDGLPAAIYRKLKEQVKPESSSTQPALA